MTGGDNQKVLETSYRVPLAKCSVAETIGEILMKSAAKILGEVMTGNRVKQTYDLCYYLIFLKVVITHYKSMSTLILRIFQTFWDLLDPKKS